MTHISAVVSVAVLSVQGGATAAGYTPSPSPPTDGRIGSNYTPAYAVNQVQFWHDFRPKIVERELAAARRYFGISTLRVYLHDINFFQEKKVLMAHIETFLALCARHGIRPGFVFFDGCHRHEGIFLDKPTKPVPGFHNGCWAQSPRARDIDPDHLEKFRPYVQEIRPRASSRQSRAVLGDPQRASARRQVPRPAQTRRLQVGEGGQAHPARPQLREGQEGLGRLRSHGHR